MNTLLDSIIKAHGGTRVWDEFTDIVTDVDLRGELFEQAGWRTMLPQSRLFISIRSQRAIFLLPEGRGQIILKPDRLTHFNEAREQVDTMVAASARIAHIQPGFVWDTLSAAYVLFNLARRSIASPLLYTFSGCVTEEVAPWSEDGEVWRVLKVTFPNGDDVPSRVQYAYYGPDGLLRRVRNATVLDGLDRVEYVSSYSDVDGVQIPLRRDVFACDPAGHTVGDQPLGRLEFRDTFLTA